MFLFSDDWWLRINDNIIEQLKLDAHGRRDMDGAKWGSEIDHS